MSDKIIFMPVSPGQPIRFIRKERMVLFNFIWFYQIAFLVTHELRFQQYMNCGLCKLAFALLRYIVFYCKLGCDTSEPHVSYISRACSSLVRHPYYALNRFILKISGLDAILVPTKGHQDGKIFYMDEYTLIFLSSRCIRCTQKRDCGESVRFASERSRVRIPLGPPICRIVLYDAAFFMPKKLWQTVPGSEP